MFYSFTQPQNLGASIQTLRWLGGLTYPTSLLTAILQARPGSRKVVGFVWSGLFMDLLDVRKGPIRALESRGSAGFGGLGQDIMPYLYKTT